MCGGRTGLYRRGLLGLDWVAPAWAADDDAWWGWLMRPIANGGRVGVLGVAMRVACKQQVPE